MKELKSAWWEDLEVMSESIQPKTFGRQSVNLLKYIDFFINCNYGDIERSKDYDYGELTNSIVL